MALRRAFLLVLGLCLVYAQYDDSFQEDEQSYEKLNLRPQQTEWLPGGRDQQKDDQQTGDQQMPDQDSQQTQQNNQDKEWERMREQMNQQTGDNKPGERGDIEQQTGEGTIEQNSQIQQGQDKEKEQQQQQQPSVIEQNSQIQQGQDKEKEQQQQQPSVIEQNSQIQQGQDKEKEQQQPSVTEQNSQIQQGQEKEKEQQQQQGFNDGQQRAQYPYGRIEQGGNQEKPVVDNWKPPVTDGEQTSAPDIPVPSHGRREPCVLRPISKLPPGYVRGYERNLYKIHTTTKTWLQALAICNSEGAHLAVPRSASEAKFIGGLYKPVKDKIKGSHDKELFFLGINDIAKEGQFYSILGESEKEFGYVNWQKNEPNNASKDEHCVLMNWSGLYWDGPCSKTFAFACKIAQ